MTQSLISKIHRLSPDECVVLQEQEGPGGTLRVTQHNQYRWLQIEDANIQSLIDINDPARVLSPTSILMLMGLAFTEGRTRLLNLGLGGGAIERSLQASHPELTVESVEFDSRVIKTAREYFFLADNQFVHEQDAERFLQSSPETYDLVMADLFSEGQSAACVSRSSFFKDIERCLSPGGVCVMNLLYTHQSTLVKTLKAAREHLPVTWLVEVKGHQNVIVYFMRQRQRTDALLQRACEDVLNELNADKLTFDWELVSLPNRV